MSDTQDPGPLPAGTAPPMPQWLRKADLILAGGSIGYDISESFRFTFKTTQAESGTLGSAEARIYNLSSTTVNKILKQAANAEGEELIINAGYQNPVNYGTIFRGTICQFMWGKEKNTDSFLSIFAQDGDILNFTWITQTVAGNVTQAQQQAAINAPLVQAGVMPPGPDPMTQVGGVLPRGKVLNGTGTQLWRNLGQTRQSVFKIINGVITEIPLTGYLPGVAIELNSATGLIGTPTVTQAGIYARCLLNPRINIGQLVKLNNSELTRVFVTPAARSGNTPADPANATSTFAFVAADGLYKVACVEHSGDTRGNNWATDMVLLAVDPSAPPGNSVSLTGVPGDGPGVPNTSGIINT